MKRWNSRIARQNLTITTIAKKTLPPIWLRPNLGPQPHRARMSRAFVGLRNMRNFKARQGALLLFATAAVFLCPRLGYARGEEVVSTTESVSESKPVPEDELGTGNYSRFPFKVSVSIRGGYDDNVTTSNAFKQVSWFTNGDVSINYDFGSPRTQLNLRAGAGATR